jgi:dUTP pyrophosphatase
MKNSIDVYIKVEGDGKIPQYASKHAAGCDLYATEDMAVRPGETKIMPLDFNMAINADMEAQIRPRSGLSLKTQLRIPNGPGTIDSDYRDKVGVILQNIYNIANLPYEIAQKPELLETLCKDYKEIELADYLSTHNDAKQASEANRSSSANQSTTADQSPLADLAVLRQKIIVDKLGNPYGTIYINKGERIAQMVFCEFKKANFILHDNPREIGEDRGGGFGHTGKG